MQSKKVEDGRK